MIYLLFVEDILPGNFVRFSWWQGHTCSFLRVWNSLSVSSCHHSN